MYALWTEGNLRTSNVHQWKTFEFFVIGVSVRLSERSLHREEQKKNFVKNCPRGTGLKPGPPDPQANALPNELSQHSVASLNLPGIYKVMLYWSCSRNEQSPTCEVVHETNKAHFRNLLAQRFLPSSPQEIHCLDDWCIF